MRHFVYLAIAAILMATLGGCAVQFRQDRITQSDITEEEPTPEPTDDFAPVGETEPDGEDDITAFLDEQHSDDDTVEDESNSSPPTDTDTENEEEEENDIEETDITEQDIPSQPRTPMTQETQVESVDPDRLRQALDGAGVPPRRQAALELTREGMIMADEGNVYVAEKRFERALSVDPSCGQAYLALAEVRFSQQRWREAVELSTRAALRLGESPYFLSRAYLIAAKSLINTGDARQAYRACRQAIEADPNNMEAYALQRRLEAYLGI